METENCNQQQQQQDTGGTGYFGVDPLSPKKHQENGHHQHHDTDRDLLYQQFDQLVTLRNKKNNRHRVENDTNTMNDDGDTNNGDDDDGPTTTTRRQRVKSFIEFDDEDDNDDQNSGKDGRYRQRSSLTSTTITGGDDYKQDLINVFENTVKEPIQTTQEEWNDFQTSSSVLDHTINGGGESCDDDGNDNNGTGQDDDDHLDGYYHHHQDMSMNDKDDGQVQEEFDDTDGDSDDDGESQMLYGKLNKMEQEQELLNNSLLALTSHFAQVQLRLRQIVEAKDIDSNKRETLLEELENFANRGIPELLATTTTTNTINHGLERSVSMATSLMADDVFEDDNDDDGGGGEQQSGGEDFIDDQQRTSWSCYSDGQRSRNYSTSLISEDKLERQRNRQKELISQLKEQLEDLERYAYETGELNALPSSMLLERQNAIIEQLKNKLPILSIDEIDQLSPDELRRKVDHAVKELVNPVLMKEQLVSQLKTQVTDLERFIEFLQESGGGKKKRPYSGSGYLRRVGSFLKKNPPANATTVDSGSTTVHQNGNCSGVIQENGHRPPGGRSRAARTTSSRQCNNHDNAQSIFKRILSLLHVFAWTQLGGCASFARNDSRMSFKQNTLKRQPTSAYARHWGDLRAHLEMAIGAILDFNRDQEQQQQETGGSPKTDDDFIALGSTALVIENYFSYEQMTILVRKELSVALRNLIQHGLIGANIESGSSVSTVSVTNNLGAIIGLGLGCFSTQSGGGAGISSRNRLPNRYPMHAWELILYYYELKNGKKYRSTPTRRLTQSFGLQVVSGSQASNPKHSLLVAIDDIIDSHTPLKRSLDSHFKAFVCTGLNQRMLSQWLRLILRHPTIVSECYEKWSYTAMTGFEDALRGLDKLSNIRFCLPTDLAVRQLQSIHDAF